MICRCFGQTFNLSAIAKTARATAELVAGLPDYDTYTAHQTATHPDQPVMTRNEFFRARQAARFSNVSGLRCC